MNLNKSSFVKIFSFLLLISLFSCVSSKQVDNSGQKINAQIELQIKQMTLHEKIGQLFVIRPESIDNSLSLEQVHTATQNGVTKITNDIINCYNEYPAGGFALFQKNIKNPQQIINLNEQIHNLNSVKPLIFVDEEGGPISRIATNKNFYVPLYKNMAEIGNSHDEKQAYEAGKQIGSYLKHYGFDIDFAPVADVNTNPNNPVIGERAFSSDPNVAAKMDVAFLNGLKSENITGCIKHFPGHGDTRNDTHKGYVETLKDWDELKKCELITFKRCINNGVEIIMTAHISTPNITDDNKPATLSHYLLTEKLRKELKFNGVIITDAMEMGAIRKEYSSDQAAVMAVLAGADIILMPYDYKRAYDGILKAVENGTITEKRIDQSLKRILNLKYSL